MAQYFGFIENAIKWAPTRVRVTINLVEDRYYDVKQILNSGSVMDKESIKAAGSEFFKKLKSGYRTGLGIILSLVKQLSGQMSFHLDRHKETTVSIKLPNTVSDKETESQSTELGNGSSVINGLPQPTA